MTSFMQRRLGPLAAALLLAAGSGCGGKPPLRLAPVQGTVTYQGKAPNHGRVVFTPQANTSGPQAVGAIQPDGSFPMMTAGEDGAACISFVPTAT